MKTPLPFPPVWPKPSILASEALARRLKIQTGGCRNARGGGGTGLRTYQRLFGRERHGRTLDRGSLPTPMQYLNERNLLKRTVRGEWASIYCPSHKGGAEKHPSLRVNLRDAHFRCMACNVSGGDLVALHRLITGCSFLEAVRNLGGRFHD